MSEHLVYGMHAVLAALTNPHRIVKMLFINQDRMDQRIAQLIEKAKERTVPIEYLNAQLMKQRFAAFSHQGVLAHASPLPHFNENQLDFLLESGKKPGLILILDGVTDPHNLGACLRSADAAGVDFIIIPKDKSASVNPVVSKVACGAAEAIPVVRVTNLVRAMENLKKQGVWIYGAAGEAENSLYQIDSTGTIAIVMGAEGEGLRRLTRECCDGLFALPMLGSVDSLNVSVATGISLYEVIRQRSKFTS